MATKTRRKLHLPWWHIPLFSGVVIAVLFVGWEIMESTFLKDVPFSTRRWLYIGRGVFGAACIGILTGILVRRHDRRIARMRQDLIQHEKLAIVGQMAAGLAHEIGNPLASISSIAQMLERSGLAPREEARVKLIGGEIDRIARIVRQLIDFARPQRGTFTKLDLRQVLNEALEIARYDPRARELRIERHYEAGLSPVSAIREHLMQVFLNVIYNAMDAMPDGGLLTIRLRSQDDALMIEFNDSGVGIDPQQQGRVFEPFFTTKRPSKGSGLGLAISRHLLALHRGTITLDGRPGNGTTVRITLPIWTSREERGPAPAVSRSSSGR